MITYFNKQKNKEDLNLRCWYTLLKHIKNCHVKNGMLTILTNNILKCT